MTDINSEMIERFLGDGPKLASQEELDAIRNSAIRAIGDADCHEVMRRLLDETGQFDRRLWATGAELGWLGIGIPEGAGGFGLGISAQCVIAEELGDALGSIPYALHCSALSALARASDDFRAIIEAGVKGEVVLSVAAPGVHASGATVVDDRLTGSALSVPAAAFADYLLLSVADGGLFLLSLDAGGVQRQSIDAIDNSRGYAHLRFDGVKARRIGGAEASRHLLDDLSLLATFEQIGMARRTLAIAREYACERRAFGQRIGTFQAIKHELAEFYVANQIARGAALNALESPAARFSFAVSCARLAAMRAVDYCTQESIQIHGGIGGTWEAAPHLYLRRARATSIDLGPQEFWRARILSLAETARNAGHAVAGDDELAAAYRARARVFLQEHAPNYSGTARKGMSQEDDLDLGRKWQALKSDHGFALITMPIEYGGGGGTNVQKVIFGQEEAKFDLPTAYFAITNNMPIPIMMAYASEEQKRELMPKAIRGEQIWCQLFSEPAAGSDLAGLRMTARREGDNWVLNGQKLWTSWAQYADWGIIVVRHDPTVAKHKGLTYFFVDMKAPGVSVRPVRMMGPNHVNEVFFDEVVVPDAQRLGAVGQGFGVAIETLMIERYSVTDSWGYGPDPIKIFSSDYLSRAHTDPDLRDAVATVLYEAEALAAVGRQAFKAITEGQEPGPEGSIAKLVLMRSRQRLARLAMDAAGPEAIERKPGLSTYERFTESWLLVPLNRIAGGTDQILRNTIAERILGLPQDHRPDKGVPFKNIPR